VHRRRAAARALGDNPFVARTLATPLCDRLGIEYPILSAGIGQAAGPELVSAVSNAGGFGVLGLSGTTPAEMRRIIGRTRELTERPFGVNVYAPLWAGESVSVVNDIVPTGEVISRLARDAAAAFVEAKQST
jgi:Nitronate monooxygenase